MFYFSYLHIIPRNQLLVNSFFKTFFKISIYRFTISFFLPKRCDFLVFSHLLFYFLFFHKTQKQWEITFFRIISHHILYKYLLILLPLQSRIKCCAKQRKGRNERMRFFIGVILLHWNEKHVLSVQHCRNILQISRKRIV